MSEVILSQSVRDSIDLRLWRAVTDKMKSTVAGRKVQVYDADADEIVRRLEALHEHAEVESDDKAAAKCQKALAAVRKAMVDSAANATDSKVAEQRAAKAAPASEKKPARRTTKKTEPVGSEDIADEHGHVTSPEAKQRLAEYNEAKEEAVAVKQAEKAGRKRPATPALDKLERKAVNGGAEPKGRKTEQPDAPKTARSEQAIYLKSDKHATLIKSALGRSGGAKIVDSYLVVSASNAQAVLDRIAAASDKNEHVYDQRLFTATAVELRRVFPKTSDGLRGVTLRLVDGLNILAANKKLAAWGINIKIDGTLTWSVEPIKGGVSLPHEPVGARDMLVKVDAGLEKAGLIEDE